MNNIANFAVRADDVSRAKAFYENVFGWTFHAWGPPDFYVIQTSPDSGIQGLLERRETPLGEGGMCAFECTVAVSDVDAIQKAVEANGGTMVFQKSTIEGVGELIRFKDTEGNYLCAMKYVSR